MTSLASPSVHAIQAKSQAQYQESRDVCRDVVASTQSTDEALAESRRHLESSYALLRRIGKPDTS